MIQWIAFTVLLYIASSNVASTSASRVPPEISVTNVTCSPYSVSYDILEIGCWGYKQCLNGTIVIYVCPNGTVLERDTKSCVLIGFGNTDCGKVVECRVKADGLYADTATGCQSYHQCHEGVFFDHRYCPEYLLFNERAQACDYKENIDPPCGTNITGK